MTRKVRGRKVRQPPAVEITFEDYREIQEGGITFMVGIHALVNRAAQLNEPCVTRKAFQISVGKYGTFNFVMWATL